MSDVGGGEEGVDGEGGAGFALAIRAVAAMDDQRFAREAVADEAAYAATFKAFLRRWIHWVGLRRLERMDGRKR